ncbi:hypothetical protein DV515_00016173, partial [Chloebia gouldiae]
APRCGGGSAARSPLPAPAAAAGGCAAERGGGGGPDRRNKDPASSPVPPPAASSAASSPRPPFPLPPRVPTAPLKSSPPISRYRFPSHANPKRSAASPAAGGGSPVARSRRYRHRHRDPHRYRRSMEGQRLPPERLKFARSEPGGSPVLLAEPAATGRAREKLPTRAELESALRAGGGGGGSGGAAGGFKDIPGTSAVSPGSSKQCAPDTESPSGTGEADYCRRILVRDAKGTIREIVLPKGLDLDRPKRTRTSFTAEQLYRLELEFQRCQYVVGRERTELARQLNLSETQVRPAVAPRARGHRGGRVPEPSDARSEVAAECARRSRRDLSYSRGSGNSIQLPNPWEQAPTGNISLNDPTFNGVGSHRDAENTRKRSQILVSARDSRGLGIQQVLDAIPTSQPASEHIPGASPAHVAPLIPALPGSRGVGGTIKLGLSGDTAVAGPGWHSPWRFPNSPKNPAGGINPGFLGERS